jgi:hypothetical protein
MSAALVYGENCKYCREVISFIQEHPILIPMIRTHNINRQGVPEGITRVPVILTSSGERHVGMEALRWLENMIPTTFEGNQSGIGYSFDEPFDGVGDGFPLDSYGLELAPHVSKELKERIEKPLNEAYADIKKKHENM